MSFLPLAKIAEFLLIASLVLATAWESWRGPVFRVMKEFDIRFRSSWFILGSWFILVGTYCVLFSRESEFTQLLALLMELAGVTYLAREVYVAQIWEREKRLIDILRPCLALESITDDKAYIKAHFALQGDTVTKADKFIAAAEFAGLLSKEVKQLKEGSRRRVEDADSRIADTVEAFRPARLKWGIILLAFGLVGHGLNELIPHEPPEMARLRNLVTETQGRINDLDSSIHDEQTQLSQRIDHLEQDRSSQAVKIGALITKNKGRHHAEGRPPQ